MDQSHGLWPQGKSTQDDYSWVVAASSDYLFAAQCGIWFERETRSKTKPSFPDSILPISQPAEAAKCRETHDLGTTQDSVESQYATPAVAEEIEVPVCFGCDGSNNYTVTSCSYLKAMANNTGVCDIHRFATEALLNMYQDPQKSLRENCSEIVDVSNWTSGNILGFAVNEDRRLRNGVRKHGNDAWPKILQDNIFAPDRSPQDLETRWKFISPR